MKIETDDPRRSDVRLLLSEHLAEMFATSPPESVHALDAEALAVPGITFYSARDDDGLLLGCGALREFAPVQGEPKQGELKSMRTTAAARGRGVASALLTRILAEARSRGYASVSLETGVEDYIEAARRLYERHGFVRCAPFAAYTDDPNSVYLRLPLAA